MTRREKCAIQKHVRKELLFRNLTDYVKLWLFDVSHKKLRDEEPVKCHHRDCNFWPFLSTLTKMLLFPDQQKSCCLKRRKIIVPKNILLALPKNLFAATFFPRQLKFPSHSKLLRSLSFIICLKQKILVLIKHSHIIQKVFYILNMLVLI